MPSIVNNTEYTPPKRKPAPKQQQPQWVPKYEPYNPFAPKKESRNETIANVNATREPWRPFQTVANIFEQAVNNPYNPFSRTQTMIGPQNNPWAPFAGMPVTQRRMTFAGIPTSFPAYATGAQERKVGRMEQIPTSPYGATTTGVRAMTSALDWNALRAQDVADWRAAGGTNIKRTDWFDPYDPAGSPYMTSQIVNAPAHYPSGGGWSSWGGGWGGGGGGSSAAFYQGNYTQQRARWNETLLTWGLRQE